VKKLALCLVLVAAPVRAETTLIISVSPAGEQTFVSYFNLGKGWGERVASASSPSQLETYLANEARKALAQDLAQARWCLDGYEMEVEVTADQRQVTIKGTCK